MRISRTADGKLVLPILVAFIFGGTFRQENGGYSTYPGGVLRQTLRYRQFNRTRYPDQEGYQNWWQFVDPRPRYGFPGGKSHKQSWLS